MNRVSVYTVESGRREFVRSFATRRAAEIFVAESKKYTLALFVIEDPEPPKFNEPVELLKVPKRPDSGKEEL